MRSGTLRHRIYPSNGSMRRGTLPTEHMGRDQIGSEECTNDIAIHLPQKQNAFPFFIFSALLRSVYLNLRAHTVGYNSH